MLTSMSVLARAAALSGLALLVIPSLAAAAPYTIAAPIAINDAGSGVVGTLSPVLATGAASGSEVTAGVFTNSTALDILYFELTLSAGSADVDQLGVGGAGVLPVGAAYFAASGTQNPNQTAGSAIELPGSTGVFNFEHLLTAAGNLQAGESTGILAVSFSPGDLPPPGIGPFNILADTATFMISSGADFSINAIVVPVPEPGTALLMGIGLAGLTAVKRTRYLHRD